MTHRVLAFAAAALLPFFFSAAAQVPAAIDVDSVPTAHGAWSYRAIAGGSEADFVDAVSAVRFAIRCNRAARTVSIVRTGAPHAAATLSVWTSFGARSVPARFLPSKHLVADIAASDPLLDWMAFSGGRFATAAQGLPLLGVPATGEPGRVVEDCRS